MRQPMNPTTVVQRAFAYIVLTVLAVAPLLEGVGLYGQFEGIASEAIARIIKWPKASRVAMVRISTSDADAFVGADKRLVPAELEKLILTIQRGKPASIGVDIDTADSSFADLAAKQLGTVLWGIPAVYSNVHQEFFISGALGGKCSSRCGVSAVRTGADKTVRQFFRAVPVVTGSLKNERLTLNSILLGMEDMSTGPRMIDFRWRTERTDLTAGEVKDLADAKLREKFHNKVVLVGTDFTAADEHHTPLGWKRGIDLVADIIDTELDGRAVEAPSRLKLLGIAALLGYLVWAIFHWMPTKAPLFALLAIPFGTVLASEIAYRSLADFVLFAPVMIAVWAQQMYVRLKERSDAKTAEASRAHATTGA
jgi:CHASE2 domain-containing sensor protein